MQVIENREWRLSLSGPERPLWRVRTPESFGAVVWAVGPRTVGRLTIVLPHVLARLAVGSRARHSDTNKFKSSSFKPRLQGSAGTLSRDTVVTFACRDRLCQTHCPANQIGRAANGPVMAWLCGPSYFLLLPFTRPVAAAVHAACSKLV